MNHPEWISLAQISFMLLLFLLVFVSFYLTLDALLSFAGKRSRLVYRKHAAFSRKTGAALRKYGVIYRNIADLLESVNEKWKPSGFFMLTLILFLSGILSGVFLFQSLRAVLILAFMSALMPYLLLRMKLISMQMKTRMEFLPAVEIFYQRYVLSGTRNLRVVLSETLREDRLTYPMKPVFERLNRDLHTNRDPEESLRIFRLALGHEWGNYFAGIFMIGLEEGMDITENLKELIQDMRKAQRADQAERNRLLEIRIANFTPILFLSVFLALNYYLNPEQAIRYYVFDPTGKNMLLEALLLIFLSFLMGVYLSLRRM